MNAEDSGALGDWCKEFELHNRSEGKAEQHRKVVQRSARSDIDGLAKGSEGMSTRLKDLGDFGSPGSSSCTSPGPRPGCERTGLHPHRQQPGQGPASHSSTGCTAKRYIGRATRLEEAEGLPKHSRKVIDILTDEEIGRGSTRAIDPHRPYWERSSTAIYFLDA